MFFKVFIGKAIDFSKVYDKGFAVVSRVIYCSKQMKAFHSSFPHFIPMFFPLFEIRIFPFKYSYGTNWAHGYKSNFLLIKVTTLCEHDHVKKVYWNVLCL